MNNIDRITKLTEQYNKALELARKHRDRAKEQTELAEKQEKKAGDLEKEIKYQKGQKIYDRVNALGLTAEELGLVLKLLDDKVQLLDAVQLVFPEKIQDDMTTGQEGIMAGTDGEEDKKDEEDEEMEVPYIDTDDEMEDPVFGGDDMTDTDRKGDGEGWRA